MPIEDCKPAGALEVFNLGMSLKSAINQMLFVVERLSAGYQRHQEIIGSAEDLKQPDGKWVDGDGLIAPNLGTFLDEEFKIRMERGLDVELLLVLLIRIYEHVICFEGTEIWAESAFDVRGVRSKRGLQTPTAVDVGNDFKEAIELGGVWDLRNVFAHRGEYMAGKGRKSHLISQSPDYVYAVEFNENNELVEVTCWGTPYRVGEAIFLARKLLYASPSFLMLVRHAEKSVSREVLLPILRAHHLPETLQSLLGRDEASSD